MNLNQIALLFGWYFFVVSSVGVVCNGILSSMTVGWPESSHRRLRHLMCVVPVFGSVIGWLAGLATVYHGGATVQSSWGMGGSMIQLANCLGAVWNSSCSRLWSAVSKSHGQLGSGRLRPLSPLPDCLVCSLLSYHHYSHRALIGWVILAGPNPHQRLGWREGLCLCPPRTIT